MFSQKEVDSTLEEAFNGALEILRVLSQQSAQAAHYYEILNLLRNAVDEQRQRLRENPPPDKKYVSKLFSLNNRRSSPQPQRALTSPFEPGNPAELIQVQPLAVDPAYTDPEGSGFLFDAADDGASFPNWEGMELPLWDRFPFIDDSFLN
jgi:hypothetical protein